MIPTLRGLVSLLLNPKCLKQQQWLSLKIAEGQAASMQLDLTVLRIKPLILQQYHQDALLNTRLYRTFLKLSRQALTGELVKWWTLNGSNNSARIDSKVLQLQIAQHAKEWLNSLICRSNRTLTNKPNNKWPMPLLKMYSYELCIMEEAVCLVMRVDLNQKLHIKAKTESRLIILWQLKALRSITPTLNNKVLYITDRLWIKVLWLATKELLR